MSLVDQKFANNIILLCTLFVKVVPMLHYNVRVFDARSSEIFLYTHYRRLHCCLLNCFYCVVRLRRPYNVEKYYTTVNRCLFYNIPLRK